MDTIFDFVAATLQETTGLDKLEARGTLRIALKAAGLDSRSVTPLQMSVMLVHAMPVELTSRGVAGAEALCREIAASARSFAPAGHPAPVADADSPEEVFKRLGGGR